MTKPVAGPNPNPRKPDLRLPAGSCDSHCHIFGPAAQFPYFSGRSYTPPDVPFEQYAQLMQTLGIERSVIVQPSIYGTDNACTEDGIRRLGKNGRGVAVIDPEIHLSELRRLAEAGFKGARLNLYHPGGSTPLEQLEAVASRCAEVDWHTQIYIRGRLLPEILPRLKSLPTPIVLDHLAHMEYGQGLDQPGFKALRELLDGGKCWVKLCPYRFDISGPPYPEARKFVRAMYEAAPDRMVWGTDYPHPDVAGPTPDEPGPMPDDGDLVDAIATWFDSDADIRKVMVDNPKALYGFED